MSSRGSAPRGAGSSAAVLHIDWTRCDGRGLCVELLGAALGTDEWGFPVPHHGAREPVIAPEDLRAGRRAVQECPMQALRLRPVVTEHPSTAERSSAPSR